MHISFSFITFHSVSQCDNTSSQEDFPERWTAGMFLQQKVQYPWASEENTQLECRDVNNIGSEHTQEIRGSREWCNSEMSVNGESTRSQNNWRH
jgi:hypothetical protein